MSQKGPCSPGGAPPSLPPFVLRRRHAPVSARCRKGTPQPGRGLRTQGPAFSRFTPEAWASNVQPSAPVGRMTTKGPAPSIFPRRPWPAPSTAPPCTGPPTTRCPAPRVTASAGGAHVLSPRALASRAVVCVGAGEILPERVSVPSRWLGGCEWGGGWARRQGPGAGRPAGPPRGLRRGVCCAVRPSALHKLRHEPKGSDPDWTRLRRPLPCCLERSRPVVTVTVFSAHAGLR